ncbi:MAG TPA: hypothetical protein ENI79_05365 [Rhodospirillales bacterium]|nr:hypothetical protein [Rhodospirillales bacterium]
MKEDSILFDQWIEESLRSVVQRALKVAETHGLPGEHHFYITFCSDAGGVRLPKFLKAQYPEEMTIVVQNQYENMKVEDDAFEVTLRFNGKPAHLRIPYTAITIFTDPSVNFGLQFKGQGVEGGTLQALETPAAKDQEPESPKKDSGGGQTGEIIALDAFRKKR